MRLKTTGGDCNATARHPTTQDISACSKGIMPFSSASVASTLYLGPPTHQSAIQPSWESQPRTSGCCPPPRSSGVPSAGSHDRTCADNLDRVWHEPSPVILQSPADLRSASLRPVSSPSIPKPATDLAVPLSEAGCDCRRLQRFS